MPGTRMTAPTAEGMKIHSGVDAGTGYVHTITATSANVHDIDEAPRLIREDDEVVYGDYGYSGMSKRPEFKTDEHLAEIEYRTSIRPSSMKTTEKYKGIHWEKQIENRKSSVRCKVEHLFLFYKAAVRICQSGVSRTCQEL